MILINSVLVAVFALVVPNYDVAAEFSISLGYLPKGTEYRVIRNGEQDASGQFICTVQIVGEKLTDRINIPCTTNNNNMFSLVNNDVVILDDVIYSDQPNSVIVRIDETCQQRSYKNGELSVSMLPDAECNRVKQAMKDRKPVSSVSLSTSNWMPGWLKNLIQILQSSFGTRREVVESVDGEITE